MTTRAHLENCDDGRGGLGWDMWGNAIRVARSRRRALFCTLRPKSVRVHSENWRDGRGAARELISEIRAAPDEARQMGLAEAGVDDELSVN